MAGIAPRPVHVCQRACGHGRVVIPACPRQGAAKTSGTPAADRVHPCCLRVDGPHRIGDARGRKDVSTRDVMIPSSRTAIRQMRINSSVSAGGLAAPPPGRSRSPVGRETCRAQVTKSMAPYLGILMSSPTRTYLPLTRSAWGNRRSTSEVRSAVSWSSGSGHARGR